MARRKRYNHKRRRGSLSFLYKLLAFVLICTAIALALTLFFRIRTIDVSGSQRYSAQEIIDAAEVQVAPNSAGSQFFIMVADAPHLDGQYAAFGKITDNAQAAVDISRVNRDMFTDKPKKPQTIKSIRVDTQGVEYPAPEKH